MDGQDVGADALDLGPHGHQVMGQVGHLGFLGGVYQPGGAFGQGGGHHEIFGAGDRGGIQVDFGPVQALGLGLDIALVQGDFHPHGLEALEVQVNGPGADGAAAGERHAGLAGPGHQRPQDQDRSPHGLDQLIGGHPAGELGGVHHQGVAVFELHPHDTQKSFDGADVRQGGDVVEVVDPRGQQSRREYGQRGVLGAADGHLAL